LPEFIPQPQLSDPLSHHLELRLFFLPLDELIIRVCGEALLVEQARELFLSISPNYSEEDDSLLLPSNGLFT